MLEKMFLVLENAEGEHQYELLDTLILEEATEIAKDALEDVPIVYIYPSYEDERYGTQPALHLDYIDKFELKIYS